MLTWITGSVQMHAHHVNTAKDTDRARSNKSATDSGAVDARGHGI
jgi:hypothetical protein